MVHADELLGVLDEITEEMATKWQNPNDGGWSADPPVAAQNRSSDVWSTAEMVLWLSQYDHTRYSSQISGGLEYLASTQHIEDNFVDGETDGGWGWQIDRASEATATTLALLAFVRSSKHEPFGMAGGGNYPFLKNMGAARDWLVTHVNPDGGWSLLPSQHSSAFNTCWASIALRECIDVPGLEDPRITAAILPNALSLVESTRRAAGWGNVLSQPADAIGTAYCTYLLLYMGRIAQANQGIAWLVRFQENEGGWRPGPAQSPVEATARALLTLLSSSSSRNQPRVAGVIQSGLRYLLDLYMPRLGWPDTAGNNTKVWTTYYACRALLAHVDAIREEQGSGGLPFSRKRKRVFIVHGHHAALRAEVKSIVQRLMLEPVVLVEMPPHGLTTLMEKFEYYAKDDGVDYALVLLTPDDMIASENAMGPRDNVVFELGWFMAKLGRERVCLLWDPAVKLPTDLDGVGRINIRNEHWQDELTAELHSFLQLQNNQSTGQE